MLPESHHFDGVEYEMQDYDSPSGGESDPLASSSEHEAEIEAEEEALGATMEDLLDEARRGRRRRRRKATKRRPNEVPPHLASVMGSATMSYMQKRYDEAEASLRHVISEAPRAVAPYRTLGLIYEERGEIDKARETFMTAAELDRQDRELWKRVAVMWDEAGDPEKAIMCLTQALKGTFGGDAEALRGRGVLLMKTGKFRRAADSFVKLSKVAPADVEVARMLSLSYRNLNEPGRAVPPIEAMIRSCDIAINTGRGDSKLLPQLIEILIYLRLVEGKYYEASLLLTRLQHDVGNQAMTFVQRLMLAICQHRLGSPVLAHSTFKEFMASPPMRFKHRDLLKQVADATKDSGEYRTAADAYTMLLEMAEVDNESRAELYLQRAVCYKEIDNAAAAKADLECVLSLCPRHVEASLRIQEFLPSRDVEIRHSAKRKKRSSSTVTGTLSLTAREREEAVDAVQLGENLFAAGDYIGYLEHMFCALQTALRLGGSGSVDEEDHNEENNDGSSSGDDVRPDERTGLPLTPVGVQKKVRWGTQKLSHARRLRLQTIGGSVMRHVAEEQFVQLAERILVCLEKEGQPEHAHTLLKTFYSLSHLRVKQNRDLRSRLRMLNVISSLASGELATAFEYMRISLVELPQDPGAIYSYSRIEQMWAITDVQRSNSFRSLMRLVKKNPKSVGLCMVAGNCSSRGGLNIRRYTVGIYLQALRLAPHHPLVCLCLAIQVVYVAMGRRIANRNEMLMYALGFLDDYCRTRRKHGQAWHSMEADYNVGRVMQQLGISQMAENMYRQVLESDYGPVPPELDLRLDAAYNLIQIYRQSQNPQMAAAICAEHLQF